MLRRKHERKVGALGAFSLVTLLPAGCGGSGNNAAIAPDPDPKVDLTIAGSLWVHLSVYPVASTFASLQQSLTAPGMGIAFGPGQGNLSGLSGRFYFGCGAQDRCGGQRNRYCGGGRHFRGDRNLGYAGTGQPHSKSSVLLYNSRQDERRPVVRRCPDEPGRGLRTVRLWHRLP